ncbi:VPLPA-CTERM sorting domain-containing protein, partial [Loktanella sp. DJP18]|uniref:VPLPA-CTERM sorting domain-containing protein n=1 Tax=Loktanella sp. DJP18 TaxID=3409788 RepID=UPI003BB4BED7
MMTYNKFGFLAICLAIGAAAPATAATLNGTGFLTYNQINGDGIANGGFTGEVRNNIEIALRGKQRYPAANIFNYDGVDTYNFDTNALTTNPANRSVFNFDWAINVNVTGTPGAVLSSFDYLFEFDTDATAGVSYAGLDPFNTPGFYDHALGFNATTADEKVVPENNAYLMLLADSFNVAQQSQNLGFGYSADPDAPGSYNFRLSVFAKDTTNVLASSEITINATDVPAVPLPASLPLLLAGLGGLAMYGRRKTKA